MSKRAGNKAATSPLPFADDAERAVIGSMLRERWAIDVVAPVLSGGAAEFFSERNGEVYAFIRELVDSGLPVDGVVIKDEMIRRGVLERLGGVGALCDYLDAVPSAIRAADYAKIVHEKSMLRRIVSAAHEATGCAYMQDEPASAIIARTIGELQRIAELGVTDPAVGYAETLAEMIAEFDSGDDANRRGISSGFIAIDNLTGGFHPGELTLIGARPSAGKSAFAVQVVRHIAEAEQLPVMFFSLEMSRKQLAARAVAAKCGVDMREYRAGERPLLIREAMREEYDRMRQTSTIVLDDRSGRTIDEIAAISRVEHRRRGIRVVVLDYVGLVNPGVGAHNETTNDKVTRVSRGLQRLARELDIPVIVAVQLTRANERQERTPRLSDLRDSGSLEQDADVVLLLHRPEGRSTSHGAYSSVTTYETESATDVIVAKQRNGPTGTVHLRFNRRFTRFESLRSEYGE